MEVIILTIVLMAAIATGIGFIYYYKNKKKVFSSEEIYSLYNKDYKKECIDLAYCFFASNKNHAESCIYNITLKKDKIYKLIFLKELPTKDSFGLKLYNKNEQLLAEDKYIVYSYDTRYCFIVLKEHFKGNISLYNKSPHN